MYQELAVHSLSCFKAMEGAKILSACDEKDTGLVQECCLAVTSKGYVPDSQDGHMNMQKQH
jgi:hypothetical protein